jgi:redox-sensitive bicupin YhaK (pirin superfamily)
VIELSKSRDADVNGMAVRRALPQRQRRTVGAWCFVDQFGPKTITADNPAEIGPHPHIGLQTVTWLVHGEQLHRDSLGSNQVIRPGQLNLMTSGAGIIHSEESKQYRGEFLGAQMWVALPESTRNGDAAFEHHSELPQCEIDQLVASVLIGEFAGARSPARADTALVGVDLNSSTGISTLPLRPEFEYAVVLLAGTAEIDGELVTPGSLAYLGSGNEELVFQAAEPTRALLLGGEPFESPVYMWWNFVGRSKDEIAQARIDWQAHDDERFGELLSNLDRVPAPEFLPR